MDGQTPEQVHADVERQVPADVLAAEVERLGYQTFDAKTFLLGFCLGRNGALTPENVRFHAEIFLSGRDRNAHLPRPGDV